MAQWDIFREATRKTFAAMSNQEKLKVVRARADAASAKPFRQRRVESQSAKARVPTKSPYQAGTASRPVKDSVVDKYPYWDVRYISMYTRLRLQIRNQHF